MSWPFSSDDNYKENVELQDQSVLDVRGGNGIKTFPTFAGRRGSQQGGRNSQLGNKQGPHGVLSNCGSGEIYSKPQKVLQSHKQNDGDVVHYATSTINSEDGVESHLEVSLGNDGDTVIKTSHKLLVHSASHSNIGVGGSENAQQYQTTMSNNSVLRLQYGADGRTLNISSSQQMLPNVPLKQHTSTRPNSLNLAAYGAMLGSGHQRPSSACCTQQLSKNPWHEL